LVTKLKRLWTALQNNAGRIGWAFAEGAIGAGMGVLAVTLYLRSR
jgi:hypothetical protein